MSNVAQFPDRKHMTHMDGVANQIRDLTQYNDELTFAESIAILEMIKFDIMRDMRERAGVIDEE